MHKPKKKLAVRPASLAPSLLDGVHDPLWSASQAMRQDLTVQHLRNELAVRIYQAHARAALEYGDSAEYNQCQTQLNVLAVEVSWSAAVTAVRQAAWRLNRRGLLTGKHAGIGHSVIELTPGCWPSAGCPRCGVPRVPGIPAAIPDCARAGWGDVCVAVGAAPCDSRGDTY